MKVNFVTLGGASERLDVPSPTLRNWTNQLEEYRTHYTKRNSRNERVYYKEDLEIFKFIKDMRLEHGGQTATRDIAKMLLIDSRFKLRDREDDLNIVSEDLSSELELLSQEDIKELMDRERVKQFIQIIVDQTTKNIKEGLVEDVTESIKKELMVKSEEDGIMQEKTLNAIHESQDRILSRVETYKSEKSSSKGFFSRIFGF